MAKPFIFGFMPISRPTRDITPRGDSKQFVSINRQKMICFGVSYI